MHRSIEENKNVNPEIINKGFKNKKLIIILALVLGALIVSLIYFIILSINKDDSRVKYYTAEQAAYSLYGPKIAKEFEEYNKAMETYKRGDFKNAADNAMRLLKQDPSDEILPGLYRLAYMSYLKLNDLNSAKLTIKDYQATSLYKSLPNGSNNTWDTDLAKLDQGINPLIELEGADSDR